MDWIVSILLWGAGIAAFSILTMTLVFAAIMETRSASSKRDQSIIVTIVSLLMLGLIGMGIYVLFFTGPFDDVYLWLFYGLFFFAFFAWLFSPSSKGESTKEMLQKKIQANIMLEQLQKPFQSSSNNDNPKE